MPTMMLIVCAKRELDAIVEEWSAPVPELWMNMLKRDEDVLDVLTYDVSFHPVSA